MDQATETVSEQVTSRLDMGKEYLVDSMTGIAQALRQTGQHLREDGTCDHAIWMGLWPTYREIRANECV